MELSLFLAKLFGLTLIIYAIAIFMRPQLMNTVVKDLKPDSFLMLMAGLVGIVGGLSIILTHNLWTQDWRVLITLFGWAALLKGISYTAFPDVLLGTAKSVLATDTRRNIALGLTFLLGCYLAGVGFGMV